MAEEKTQPLRFIRPVPVEFAGQTITLEPIRGVRNIAAFQSAVTEEIKGLAARVEQHQRFGDRISMEALLEKGVDHARLLKLGAPGVITDELLDEAAAFEMAGVLNIVLGLNNMSEYVRFLAPSQLKAVVERLNLTLPDYPLPGRNGSSSPAELTGAPSSAS